MIKTKQITKANIKVHIGDKYLSLGSSCHSNTSATYPRLWPGPPSTERWLRCKFSDIFEAMVTPVEGVTLLVLNGIGNTRRYSSNTGDQWPGWISLFRFWMWMCEVLRGCEQCWRLSRWVNSGLGRVNPKWKHQCNC